MYLEFILVVLLVDAATTAEAARGSAAQLRVARSLTAGDLTATANSVEELVVAFTDDNVGTVVVGNSMTMTDAAWQGVATPYVLKRNLTLTGPVADPALWPVVDLSFVKNKVVLTPGVTLRLTRLVLARLRQGLYLQAPGMDLLASLPGPLPNTTANRSEWGHLQMDSVGLVNRACLPPGVATDYAPTIARPTAMAPGTQKVISNSSQDGCTPVSNTTTNGTASSTTPVLPGSGSDVVPYMSRCYLLTSEYVDLVLLAYNLPTDTSPRPLQAGYVIWLSRVSVKCEGYLDLACVQRLGAYTCFALMYPRSNATFTQQPSPPPASLGAGGTGTGGSSTTGGNSSSSGSVPVASQQQDAGSDGDSSVNVGVIVGPIVGGVVLIGAITTALLVRRRRLRRRGADLVADSKSGAGGGMWGGLCADQGLTSVSIDPSSPDQGACKAGPNGGSKGFAPPSTSWSDLGAAAGPGGKTGTEQAGKAEGGPGTETTTQTDDPSTKMAALGPTAGHSTLGYTPRASMEPVTALTPCKPEINMAVRVEPYTPPGSNGNNGQPYSGSDSRSRSRSSIAVGGVAAAVLAPAGAAGGGGGGLGKGASFREPSLCSVAEAGDAPRDGAGGGSIESHASASRYASSLIAPDALSQGGNAAASGGRDASAPVSMDAAPAAPYGSMGSAAGVRVGGGFAARSYGPGSGTPTVVGGGGRSVSFASSCAEDSRSNRHAAQGALVPDAPEVSGSHAGVGVGAGPGPSSGVIEAAEPMVTLLPVLRGKGAYGRVVEGIYCGQRVAVKLLNYLPSAAALAAATAEAAALRLNPSAGAKSAAAAAAATAAASAAAATAVAHASEPLQPIESDSEEVGAAGSDDGEHGTDTEGVAAVRGGDAAVGTAAFSSSVEGAGAGWLAETHAALHSYADTSSAALAVPPPAGGGGGGAGGGSQVSGGAAAAGAGSAGGAARDGRPDMAGLGSPGPMAAVRAAWHGEAAAAQPGAAGGVDTALRGAFTSAAQSLQPCATEISALESTQHLFSTAGITGAGVAPAAEDPVLAPPPPMVAPPPPMPRPPGGRGGGLGGGAGGGGVAVSAVDMLHRHYHAQHHANGKSTAQFSSSLLPQGGTMVVAPLSPQDMFVEWRQRQQERCQPQPAEQQPGPTGQPVERPYKLAGSSSTYTGPVCCTVLGLTNTGVSGLGHPGLTTLDGASNPIPLGLSIPTQGDHLPGANVANNAKRAIAGQPGFGAAPPNAPERPFVVDLRVGLRQPGAGRNRMVAAAPALKPLGEIWSPMKEAEPAAAAVGAAEVSASSRAGGGTAAAGGTEDASTAAGGLSTTEAETNAGDGGVDAQRRSGRVEGGNMDEADNNEEQEGPDVFGIAAQRAFLQELEVLARMRHPNIVQLLAACATPPQLALVVELMDTSLEDLLHPSTTSSTPPPPPEAAAAAAVEPAGASDVGATPAPAPASTPAAPPLLPYETVLHVALQVAQAIEYMHPTIIHRDIKPSNILISNADSPTPVVKLADFGLSRLQETVLITKNADVGTAAYMAPELLTVTHGVVTHHVDVYALAVCVWEMLAGRRAWEGASMVQIAVAVGLRGERPPLDDLPSERCPPPLRALLAQCWDAVPARRPAASELVKELVLLQQQHKAGALAPANSGAASMGGAPGPSSLLGATSGVGGGGPRRGHHPVANQLAALIRGGMVA